MFILFALSAGLLTVIQAPFTLGFLGWVALVPFIIACKEQAKSRPLIMISYLVSVAYWLGNLYFVAYVDVPGYIVFCMFLGMYWPVLALCVRFLRKIKFPLYIAIPFLITGAEAWQGVIFTGFSWRLLGHSQWQWPAVIQIADIFGALGVTFILAASNALIAQILIDCKKHKFTALAKPSNVIGTVVVTTLISAAIMYGKYRIAETPGHVTKGPILGTVQPNIPTGIKDLSEAGDAILDELISDSRSCFDAGARLVVWPETMVMATMNYRYLLECRFSSTPLIYHRLISDLAKDNGYILFGAHAADIKAEGSEWITKNMYNSAFLYGPEDYGLSGQQSPERYDKIHLIPFGEFIPLRNINPIIFELFLWLSHYDYDYSLTHGSKYTTFDVPIDGKMYHCGALICYEDTDPTVTRRMVIDKSGTKKVHWLVNLSNDGWYVRYDKENKKVLPSTELSQRTAITIFRAVENRVSIIRSVNTGISCIVDTTGNIVSGYTAGTLPETAMQRQGTGGWLVDTVDIDDRVTFFGLYGQLLDKLCQVMFVIVPIITLYRMVISAKKTKKY